MKYLAAIAGAALIAGAGPAFAQATNEGKPAAPAPAKAAPLQTSGKPAATKGSGGSMAKSGSAAKNKHKH